MSYQDAPIVLSDVPGGLVVRIFTYDRKTVPVVLKGPNGTLQSQGLNEGIHATTTRIEEVHKSTKPVERMREMTGRIEEIFKRSKPIEVAPRELHASPIQRDEHETRVVRQRVKEGDCLPEELAHLKPFHVYHNEDGSLELYWLVYNRLRRVG